jgi:hypothetical protein
MLVEPLTQAEVMKRIEILIRSGQEPFLRRPEYGLQCDRERLILDLYDDSLWALDIWQIVAGSPVALEDLDEPLIASPVVFPAPDDSVLDQEFLHTLACRLSIQSDCDSGVYPPKDPEELDADGMPGYRKFLAVVDLLSGMIEERVRSRLDEKTKLKAIAANTLPREGTDLDGSIRRSSLGDQQSSLER